jgi:hypothetical protein
MHTSLISCGLRKSKHIRRHWWRGKLRGVHLEHEEFIDGS